ncbi:CRISPR-associated protein, AF1875 family [Thermococcus sp. 2319x1]|uniref:CRISPR-associated endonuclease Cas3'' n=1 Tax=Thermococcus sp. 2319x1 TaxID=1674923 RepID=UPI00073A5890|nr:HD domain-containing protein [Thermococcus sp. 2319x1]ALV63032.1 CRISPR-associated protein, AF1875 family [Thermococcus sp. 2319x1]
MIPCAYFSNGKCVETMEAHVKRGLELIEKLYIKRNYTALLGKLLGVKPDVAGDILRKVYVLHDVGKCLETFQTRRGKFSYHEFYSYLVAKDVLREFGTAGQIASVAILLHHHDWVRNTLVERPPSLRLIKECPPLIKNLSGLTIPGEVPWNKPIEEYSSVEGILRKSLRAVYALLLPTVVADNYSAACNRGGAGSMLGKEILETLEVRGWDLAGCLSSGLR